MSAQLMLHMTMGAAFYLVLDTVLFELPHYELEW